jgi:hypothetical protein
MSPLNSYAEVLKGREFGGVQIMKEELSRKTNALEKEVRESLVLPKR